MAKAQKNRASKHPYVSPSQLTLVGFESPFSQSLDPNNRWVMLAHRIPWDILVSTYEGQLNNSSMGADGINPRVAIGAMILKHMCNMSDRETVLHIQENMYMQYFIGYSSFSTDPPFDPSLFVDFRKRLGIDQINFINEKILGLSHAKSDSRSDDKSDTNKPDVESQTTESGIQEVALPANPITHKGKLITDATACPQDIAYPTDLNLLSNAREKTEELIDKLYDESRHGIKPRTYRKVARKEYLKTAQLKKKSKKQIHNAVKKQLGYLKRNINSVNQLLDEYDQCPLNRKDRKYLMVINTLYEQQSMMFKEDTHQVDHRIVSIHQPHVRPIVRGKTNAYVEFGAKINVSLMNGFAFLDDFSWEAFNEGTRLMSTVEKYKQRFGYYPEEVLADKIYCNRTNRASLKLIGVKLIAKPLGRPKAVDVEHVRPGERNPIEGKFGQAKTAYGLNRIKARLDQTSESWIATIILVLNLVKLIGSSAYGQILSMLTFSAAWLADIYRGKLSQIMEPANLELSSC
ncbi:MAG: IS5 family transposase [Alphaproteobacteria bacterium]|nr:IS5 family transposase [Alphaproteobacteria bacterium]